MGTKRHPQLLRGENVRSATPRVLPWQYTAIAGHLHFLNVFFSNFFVKFFKCLFSSRYCIYKYESWYECVERAEKQITSDNLVFQQSRALSRQEEQQVL